MTNVYAINCTMLSFRVISSAIYDTFAGINCLLDVII